MSTPKPNLGRQSSRTDLNARSEESSTESSSDDSQSGVGEKKAKQPPALEQRPRPRAGTWVAATANSGASSSSNKAANPHEKASEPVLSPRGPLSPLPKPPNSSIPSTSTPSTSTPSTSKPPASAPYVKSRVPADRIPGYLANALRAGYQGMRTVTDPINPAKSYQVPVFNLPPKQIARLLVGLESNFGDKAPSGEDLTKPMRDKSGITGFQVNSELVLKEINVIEHILTPFMQRVFDRQESEQARIAVREGFNAFVSGPHKNLLQTIEGKNKKEQTLQNLAFREKFDPVMQPLDGYIFGKERRFESSTLPDEFKVFLQEIPKAYLNWSGKQKIQPEDLLGMMKNVLVGLIFIRGLNPIWTIKFNADLTTKQQAEREWASWRGQLLGQLGHYTSFKFDDFVFDIISSVKNKPKEFEDFFKPMEKAAELRRKEALAVSHKEEASKRTLKRGSTISAPATGRSNKRTNIGSFIQDLVSPRKKETSSTGAIPVSPRVSSAAERVKSSEGLLLKKTGIRDNNAKRRRVRELDQYLKSINLPKRDPGYIRHLNEAIAKRANYEIFELAPAAFCLQELETYLETADQQDQASSQNLKEVQILLARLSSEEREQAKRDVEQAKGQAPTNISSAPATVKSPLSTKPALVPGLDFEKLRNSPFAEDLAGSENASALSKTEPSDSTEVDTESSQDEQSAKNNVGDVENEKNNS